VFAALAGGGAFLLVVYVGVISKLTTMHYMYILGSLILPTASSFVDHALGFLIHMLIIAPLLGLLDVEILHWIGISSVGQAVGREVLVGAVQSLIFIIAIPILLAIKRPPVRWGHINNPGFLLLGFGRWTPFFVLAESVVLAVVTGAIYSAIVL
jgi:hypothetical protein